MIWRMEDVGCTVVDAAGPSDGQRLSDSMRLLRSLAMATQLGTRRDRERRQLPKLHY